MVKQQFGFASGRACKDLGKTLICFVCNASLPVRHTTRVLGVDDWAMCKGRIYGTIVVDLELHQPMALLVDRTSNSATDTQIFAQTNAGARLHTDAQGQKFTTPECLD